MTRRRKVESALGPDEAIFDPLGARSTAALRDLVEKGLVPVCHLCGAKLEFALSPAEAHAKSVPPGVRCPRNLNHCQIHVDFAE